MKISFYTLGCKVNQYETQVMRENAEKSGFAVADWNPTDREPTDFVVINSCTVTAESDRKLRQLIHRCRREHPEATLVVTGCMPQAFPDEAALLDADIILGNAARRVLIPYIQEYLTHHQQIIRIPAHDTAFECADIHAFDEHTRAFVKIEDGCNRFCSYCIIPYARGRVRSKPLDVLRDEVELLAQNGYKEIVLVGINLTAYGQDLGLSIADAIDTVCAVPAIQRVRLGSIEPDHVTDEMIRRFAAQPKLCPQFHLALQSGCDATLRRMRRKYTTAQYAAICEQLREVFPGCAITTDYMVGFPGETNEEFEQSLNFIRKVRPARVHIFSYSRRTGTPAATAPHQVTNKEKSARSKAAAAVCDAIQQEFAASKVGSVTQVLLETAMDNGVMFGYTPDYVGVRIQTDLPAGTILSVRITQAQNGECVGIAE